MPWIVITLTNHEPALRGWLSRYLFEIPGMTFVGRPDARTADRIVTQVQKSHGSAVIVRQDRWNEIGLSVELIGHADFAIRDFDGLRLPVKKLGTFEGRED